VINGVTEVLTLTTENIPGISLVYSCKDLFSVVIAVVFPMDVQLGTLFFKGGFIALININHTCKLQNCSLINQFTTVSLQLHAGEFNLAKLRQ
jgi:hypothetical protein